MYNEISVSKYDKNKEIERASRIYKISVSRYDK